MSRNWKILNIVYLSFHNFQSPKTVVASYKNAQKLYRYISKHLWIVVKKWKLKNVILTLRNTNTTLNTIIQANTTRTVYYSNIQPTTVLWHISPPFGHVIWPLPCCQILRAANTTTQQTNILNWFQQLFINNWSIMTR